MERKIPFTEGEIYHLFTRGVEKRQVFMDSNDRDRFMLLLFLSNSKETVHVANLLKKYQGEPLIRCLEHVPEQERLVKIIGYALMPNHIHFLVKEGAAGAISRFMLKLMTAYSMYFNTKYQRSGPLFTRPFRSRHVDTDEYFRWVFSYVHLNPLQLQQPDWKERGVQNMSDAKKFLSSYIYSSFIDYADTSRAASRIITKDALPIESDRVKTMDDLLKFFFGESNMQTVSPYSIEREKALL